MMPTRRNFLRAVAGASALRAGAAHADVSYNIGLQLYTVRDLLASDFEATLRKIARLGYREVEFAGILGPNLRSTRNLLQSFGLAAPSLHSSYSSLRKDAETAFDTALELGAKFVVCPWLDLSERQTVDDWKRVSENLSSIGELATHHGLTLAYHNHDFEFLSVVDGIRPFDLLLGLTDERFVKFELDVYWVKKGNVDPATFLKAHQSRFRLVHLKDMAKDGSFTEIGSGILDFGEIIVAALAGGVRHFFVEQDYSKDPLESIKTSIRYLQRQKWSAPRM